MAKFNQFEAKGSLGDGSGPTEIIAPYKDLFVELDGPGDARPTALQIVKDEGLEGAWSDRVALVTGASSGIGIETARALQATGARVFAGARNKEKAQKVVDEINASAPKGTQPVELLLVDLESLTSVRTAAQDLLKRSGGKLDILVNNAGVMATPEGRTKDGFETQLGVCHLSHFLLFQLLRPALQASSKPSRSSRVVVVSSMGHRSGEVNFENINFGPEGSGAYDPWKAYGSAKTAEIYFANYVDRVYGSNGIHAMSLHPGGIVTGLQSHLEDLKSKMELEEVKKSMKNPEQGAATSVWAATAKVLEGKGRLWLEDCQTCGPLPADADYKSIGYATWAFDTTSEDRLWKLSNELVGFEEK